MHMTDLELSMEFERWHKTTRQFKKYNMRHDKSVSRDGQIDYYDYRVNWAWLAFKGGWKECNHKQQEQANAKRAN